MHEWGDSGITAIVLAIIVVVVLSFGVAQQARAQAARYQEIRRLQFVTAEESLREEAEAHAEYTSMLATRNYCAVCPNTSTTRCSRCKAVRYCSSTCQVQHWKQSHKQECRAPEAVASPVSSSNGSRNFSDAFTSSGGSSSSGSRTLSEVSDVHSGEDATPGEFARTASSPTENGTLVRPKKILYPYDYFVKFFYCETLKVPPCGLINCGNSCFANVVLQCLTYTRPLTAYLLDGTHGETCRRTDWCFMCELQDHVWRVRQSPNAFSPIRILSRIRNIGNHLGYGRQEDAHEFMRFAIDSMQSICLDEAGGEKSVDPRSQETTFVHHIFGGHLQSQVKCMQCFHESNRYENMMDLAVEIQGCVETLEDALTQFTAPELLDGENKYKCDRCNAYVKARKRLTLHEAPNILTVALKRFQSGKFGKLNKRVTFPEVLDVSPYMSGKGDRPPLYRLYAVVVHVDMLNASFFGHYICYVKDSQGLWYKIDDSKVKEVDLEKVMAQRAYMLFYTRSFARPPPLTDGAIFPQPVFATPELGRVISHRQETSKVFPAPLYLQSDEILTSGGSEGLHAMVDFNQMLGDVERRPEISLEHSQSNGEFTIPQSSSWELERVSSSTSNDDDVTVEDSGCAGSSSSLTETSPYISSYTSNHGVWVPSQDFVQGPHSSTVEGTEYAKWDPKSSPSHDISEVSLQPCAMDMPCTTKIGKRRLEEGLSPLPTPKPLDTDQLPAWPAGNHGRSVPCPSLLHVSPSPTSCSISDESLSSWKKYDSEKSGEPLPSATCQVQHRASSDQMCNASVGESTWDPETADYTLAETTVSGEEESIARAKRQHVETGRIVDPQARIQRLDENVQTMENSNSSELKGRDMDWDKSLQHPGSPPLSGAVFGPVLDQHNENVAADTRQLSTVGQLLLEPLVTAQNSEPLDCDAGGSLSPQKEDFVVEGSKESICKESGTTMQESACIIPAGGIEDLTSSLSDLDKSGPGRPENLIGGAHEDTILTGETARSLQAPSSSDGLQEKILEIAACYAGVTEQDTASQRTDTDVIVENGFVNHELETNTCNKSDPATDTPAMTGLTAGPVPLSDGPVLDVPSKPLPVKVGKTKSASKPLFAPGFLNRVPPSKPKLRPMTSTKASVEENGHVNQVENQVREDVIDTPAIEQHCSSNGGSHAEDVRDVPETDKPCSPDGMLHATGNGHSPTASNVTGSSSGNVMNCEECNSARPDDLSENGHGTGNGLVPDQYNNHVTKTTGKLRAATKRRVAVDGMGSSLNSPRVNIDEVQAMERVREPVVALGRPVTGKQKQGRNETCNCGSQRKWKKCCGKAGLIKPEPGRRRLVV